MENMNQNENDCRGIQADPWVIILASRDELGSDSVMPSPYQLCGGKSLLRQTIERAEQITMRERIITVVSDQDRVRWEADLLDRPRNTVVSEPADRGTAIGVLLPLFYIMLHNWHARIVIMPVDSYGEEGEVFVEAMRHALTNIRWDIDQMILLGLMTQVRADHGWIKFSYKTEVGLQRVEGFAGDPLSLQAEGPLSQDGLWNSSVVVGTVNTFMHLFSQTVPEILKLFVLNLGFRTDEWTGERMEKIYRMTPHADFMRDVLSKATEHLLVLPVPESGWQELYRVERLAEMHHEFDSLDLSDNTFTTAFDCPNPFKEMGVEQKQM